MNQKNRVVTTRDLQYTVFMVFLLFAIQFSIAAQEQGSPVVGKWEKYLNGVTMTFELDKENNYTVDFESDGNFEVRGTYKVQGNTITFNDKPGAFASPDPGIYSFMIEKDKITFVIEDDPTEGRSGLVKGTWTKGNNQNK